MIHDIESKWTGVDEADRRIFEAFSAPVCASLVKVKLLTIISTMGPYRYYPSTFSTLSLDH
jgi:hypothetical protein